MEQLIKTLKLKYKPVIFKDRALALSYAERATKAAWVILGDQDQYWVVCPADFEKLIKGGYEPA